MTIEYLLLIPLVISFLITLFLIPAWIRRAKNAGLVGKDMNKKDKPQVAEAGGVPVIAGFVIGVLIYIALKTFYFKTAINIPALFALLTMILIISFIGLIDDLLGWKIGLSKRIRLLLVLFASIPLIVIGAGETTISLPFLSSPINLGIIYTLIIIPLGIIGASTTFNFLAGFNGLEARQGIIILAALSIAAYFTGNSWLSIVLLCMIVSLISFLIFNHYPSQIFPGDALTYSIGALIAGAAILGNIEQFAIFVFIPNIMEILLKLRGKLKVESFAQPQKDNSLELGNKGIYSLTHLAILILKRIKGKAYEKDVVLVINIIQIIFAVLAFIIFRKGIF